MSILAASALLRNALTDCLGTKPLSHIHSIIAAATVPSKSRCTTHLLPTLYAKRARLSRDFTPSSRARTAVLRRSQLRRRLYTAKTTPSIRGDSLRLPRRPNSLHVPTCLPINLLQALAPIHLAPHLWRAASRQSKKLGLCQTCCEKQSAISNRRRTRATPTAGRRVDVRRA